MKDLVPQEIIERRIFLIRGQKVMLGLHLAELYGVETRVLIQAVTRNSERFPEDFMFQLSREEISRISQTVISLKYSKRVYAFTEEGVAMLSGVLHSARAVQMNIAIMRTFVKLREIFSTHKELAQKLIELEERIERHDAEIHAIFEAIRRLMQPPEKSRRQIGFKVEEPIAKYTARRKKSAKRE
ncbi:MAG: ORF6N domain-containing protein [bacterium]